MNTISLALKGASNVLFAGLVFGVGLPVIYALAMRALTIGASVDTNPDALRREIIDSLQRLIEQLFQSRPLFVVGGQRSEPLATNRLHELHRKLPCGGTGRSECGKRISVCLNVCVPMRQDPAGIFLVGALLQ